MAAERRSPLTSGTGSAGTWTSSATTAASTWTIWPAGSPRPARSPLPGVRRGTLNGLFSATEVQFLPADESRPQHLLEQPQETGGLRIAGLSDLIAMKLKVVGGRGELRDYLDLMTIEQRTGRTVDEGLALFVARFQPEYPQQAISHILLGPGYFDDVDPDDALPVPRSEIVDYWTRRQREIITARGRLSA